MMASSIMSALWHKVNGHEQSHGKYMSRFGDIITTNYQLGFTAFGGPPVHFQIVRSFHYPLLCPPIVHGKGRERERERERERLLTNYTVPQEVC